MIFISGKMRTVELMKAGIVVKIIGILIIFIISLTLIPPIFHIHHMTLISNDSLMKNISDG